MGTSNRMSRMLRRHRGGRALGVAAVLALLAPGLDAATLRGRVTECRTTAGAPGYIVKGFEELTVGFSDLGRPCTIATQSPRQVGTTTTREDGTYSIVFTPSERDPEHCFFEANVFVRVFQPDGVTAVGRSEEKRSGSTVVFGDIDTGAGSNCPVPRFTLSLEGPSVVTGQAGETASFVVSVLLAANFEGRQGLHGAEGWTVRVGAQGGTVAGATTIGTLAAPVDADPPGLLRSCAFETTSVGPSTGQACPNLTVAASAITLSCLDGTGPVIGLPLAGPPPRILRVAIQAVLPPAGVEGRCRVFFPEGCASFLGFYRTETFGASELLDLEVTLRGLNLAQALFRRADMNGSGGVDISDAVATFSYLFLGDEGPSCFDAADSNGDGGVDISDGVNTLTYLFSGARDIPAPGPISCGRSSIEQPTMGCESYGSCGAGPV